MSLISNVILIFLYLTLVWIVIYDSWVLNFTYELSKKKCDESINCGITQGEIRTLQTFCIISICISIGSLGFLFGGGKATIFSNPNYLFVVLGLQIGVIGYTKYVIDKHKVTTDECPINQNFLGFDLNLTHITNGTLWFVSIIAVIFVLVLSFSKKSKKSKKVKK